MIRWYDRTFYICPYQPTHVLRNEERWRQHCQRCRESTMSGHSPFRWRAYNIDICPACSVHLPRWHMIYHVAATCERRHRGAIRLAPAWLQNVKNSL